MVSVVRKIPWQRKQNVSTFAVVTFPAFSELQIYDYIANMSLRRYHAQQSAVKWRIPDALWQIKTKELPERWIPNLRHHHEWRQQQQNTGETLSLDRSRKTSITCLKPPNRHAFYLCSEAKQFKCQRNCCSIQSRAAGQAGGVISNLLQRGVGGETIVNDWEQTMVRAAGPGTAGAHFLYCFLAPRPDNCYCSVTQQWKNTMLQCWMFN